MRASEAPRNAPRPAGGEMPAGSLRPEDEANCQCTVGRQHLPGESPGAGGRQHREG